MNAAGLIDPYGRKIDYVRLSVTDRCDFRCTYCMEEDVTFLPKRDILSLEEIVRIAQQFIHMGTKRLRITGGEPLVRKNILWALEKIAKTPGLEELTLTTNGSQLHKMAEDLCNAGVARLNISLDTLQADKFARLTRRDMFDQVMLGIDTALKHPFKRLKINSVILKHQNDDEIVSLAKFALEKAMDISFIEEMPLGIIHSHDRSAAYVSSDAILEQLSQQFELQASDAKTGGPSRYFEVKNYSHRIAVISPHSHNFCASCNRVRLTAEGRLLLCLGNEHSMDLKPFLRQQDTSQTLEQAIVSALALKPEKHHFDIHTTPQILRFMSATGG